MAVYRHLSVSEIGEVSVVQFLDRKIVDPGSIQELGQELVQLVEQENRRRLVLNFSNVEFFSSQALGKLNMLNRRVKAIDGKLSLSNIRPQILEVFQITKLDSVFDIRTDEADALAAVES